MILLLSIPQFNLICVSICTSEVLWTWTILASRQYKIIVESSPPSPAFFALSAVFMAHDIFPLTFIRSIIFLLALSNNCFQWPHSSEESSISSPWYQLLNWSFFCQHFTRSKSNYSTSSCLESHEIPRHYQKNDHSQSALNGDGN